MAKRDQSVGAEDAFVKNDVVTKEEIDLAKAQEARGGTPWYKQLIQMGKMTFDTAEDILRYEVHLPSRAKSESQSLGDSLLQAGVLSKEKLNEALAEQKRTGRLLGRILVDRGFVTRKDIATVLSRQYDIPYAEAAATPSQPAALDAMPESMAKKNGIIPVSLEADRLLVLIGTPQTKNRLESIGILLNKRLSPMLTAVPSIEAEISARYAALEGREPAAVVAPKKIGTAPAPKDTKNSKKEASTPKSTDTQPQAKGKNTMAAKVSTKESARFDEIAKQAAGSTASKIVSTIIEGAVHSRATDIHLDPQDPEMRVRYRIDGVLHDVMSIPQNIQAAVVSKIKIMSDLDITETRHPQDGHISMEIGERDFDIRVATLPTFIGERLVMRMLDQSSVLSGISDLGLDKDDLKKLQYLIDQPYGMILVTGPTGSGKTTTLYSALNQKNVMTESIVTIEDPVEYQLPGINQVQIDTDIDVTFASTLRASLRQDIDVLLVGEIRDNETARIAIRAAMTGHLVFSTLHTNDAPEAIATLRNMGVPSYLIASALTGVIGQRLVRTICPNCKTAFTPTSTLLKSIGLPATVKKLYQGKGCAQCYQTGNKGRNGIFEVLVVNQAVRNLIAADSGPEEITKGSKLITMAMSCRQKVKDGLINPEEFLRVVRT